MTGSWTTGLLLSACLGSAAIAAPAADRAHAPDSRSGPPIILVQTNPPSAAAARRELELWSKIRDSNDPVEIESFLAAFPNSRLAPIARKRLEDLKAKAATKPTPKPSSPEKADAPRNTPRFNFVPDRSKLIGDNPYSLAPQFRPKPSDSTAPVNLSTGIIADVQERLYQNNYNPGPIDGQMGETTVAAITQFQRNHALPTTGEIDARFLRELRNSHPPSKWGALAFHGRGAYTAVWLRPSRRQAEQDAMTGCKKRAGATCKVATAAGTQCIALANSQGGSRRRKKFQAYSYLARNLIDARGGAIEFCRSKSPYPDTCEVRAAFCADGSHNR